MTDKLKKEIEIASRNVVTDSYPVSIGEIASIYNDGELNIHPEFQRMFRWEPEQKSRLIESLFLGIPIPPIFVFQSDKNIWEVVDGLQRLSTIFEFMGILKDANDKIFPPLVLTATHFLPSLAGVSWKSAKKENSLADELQVLFKRKKLHFNILSPGSDQNTKYDLFDRLNSGGSQLTKQEIRSCLIIMINKDFYSVIDKLSQNDEFMACLPLSQDDIDVQINKEYVVRYFIAHYVKVKKINTSANIHSFLTSEIEKIASDTDKDWDDDESVFIRTFALLSQTMGENSFRRWDGKRHVGAILYGAFECIVLGLSQNIDYWETKPKQLEALIKSIYKNKTFIAATGRGVRATDRFKRLIELSSELFNNEP